MLDQVILVLNNVLLSLDTVPVGAAATVAAVLLEVALRVFKTDKPRSLIRLLSVVPKALAGVLALVEKVLLKVASLVDAIVPDRLSEPAAVVNINQPKQ